MFKKASLIAAILCANTPLAIIAWELAPHMLALASLTLHP